MIMKDGAAGDCADPRPHRHGPMEETMTEHPLSTPADTTPSEVDEILAAAAAAATPVAALPLAVRAGGLLAMAGALRAHSGELIALAMRETGLGLPRLTGELERTAVQLELFADVVVDGAYLDIRHDEADAGFALGVRPDLRRWRVPVGPVLNFAASNFPFAFSVAGGDTASALAAGCPVVVKGHRGHRELSVRTASLVAAALVGAGWPAGSFGLVLGTQAGVLALKDPRVRAGAFTGSTGAGTMLAGTASARHIPFFAEMGSVNPVVVTEAALTAAPDWQAGFVASVSGSAGQLCTKPGVVFVPASWNRDAAVAALAADVPEHRLLHLSGSSQYADHRAAGLGTPGVTVVTEGAVRLADDGLAWVTPTVVRTDLAGWLAHRDTLGGEVFGPYSVLVTYDDLGELPGVLAENFPGNLTGTVHAAPGETGSALQDVVAVLAATSGRVLFGGWPTGVAVTYAMQHGGPFPATSTDSSTSVGTDAITRFLRPVAYQSFPDDLLPGLLADPAAAGLPHHEDPAGTSVHWGDKARGDKARGEGGES
jgi:NADP-dependent aldehyde dehydrogenase